MEGEREKIDYKLLPRSHFLTSSPSGVKLYLGPSDIKMDAEFSSFRPPKLEAELSITSQQITINTGRII